MRIRDKIRDVAFGVVCIFIGSLAYGESVINTVAGNGTQGFSGDDGLALDASLSLPYRIDFDSSGRMFIADNGNHRIRMVNSTTGVITTVAGNNRGPNTFEEGSAIEIYINGCCVEVDTKVQRLTR